MSFPAFFILKCHLTIALTIFVSWRLPSTLYCECPSQKYNFLMASCGLHYCIVLKILGGHPACESKIICDKICYQTNMVTAQTSEKCIKAIMILDTSFAPILWMSWIHVVYGFLSSHLGILYTGTCVVTPTLAILAFENPGWFYLNLVH